MNISRSPPNQLAPGSAQEMQTECRYAWGTALTAGQQRCQTNSFPSIRKEINV